MHSLNIDKIIIDDIFNKNSTNIKETTFKILQHCNTLQKFILKDQKITVVKILFEFIYILNYLYKSIGLLQISCELQPTKNKMVMIEKILLNLSRKQDVDINRFTVTIDKIKQKINTVLNDTYNIDTSGINKYVQNIPPKIILNRQAYFYLQRKIRGYQYCLKEIIEKCTGIKVTKFEVK